MSEEIEIVSPAPIAVDDKIMSPPLPVAVTEPVKRAVPAPLNTVNLVTDPALQSVSSVIAAAVATPLEAAPKAVAEKVNVAISESLCPPSWN